MSPDEDDVDEERFLSAEETAANVRTYLSALEAEIEVHEEMADGLEDGAYTVEEMIERLPDPMPMEAYNRDEWEDVQDDFEADLSLPEGSDGE